jgi:hypothetical protein
LKSACPFFSTLHPYLREEPDFFGFPGPDKSFWVCIVILDVVANGSLHFGTLRKTPLRIRLCARSRNQRSITFSHELLVGVKCRRNLGGFFIHFSTLRRLCVASLSTIKFRSKWGGVMTTISFHRKDLRRPPCLSSNPMLRQTAENVHANCLFLWTCFKALKTRICHPKIDSLASGRSERHAFSFGPPRLVPELRRFRIESWSPYGFD